MSEAPVGSGLVLCWVGDFRLAFRAADVVAVEAMPSSSEMAVMARTAFALPPAPGKMVVPDSGVGVVVDALEVTGEEVSSTLKPPELLARRLAALAGFVELRRELWPVFHLAAFAEMLRDRAREAEAGTGEGTT